MTMWFKLSDETAKRLVSVCEQHAPELGEQFLAEMNRFLPEEPWQDQKAAVDFSRSRWSHEEDDIEIDDDAALSFAENGVWVQGWLWVDKEELVTIVLGDTHES